MKKRALFPSIIFMLLGCDPILDKVSDIPKDYVSSLSLDSSKIDISSTYINKFGRPVVSFRYDKNYNLVFFSIDGHKTQHLVNLLAFDINKDIEITPNVTYKGSEMGYVEVRFPIFFINLRLEPLKIITEPNSPYRVIALNDSTKFIWFENSRGFALKNEGQDYNAVVVNVQENQITKFNGKTDLGMLVYHRANIDYAVLVYPRNSNNTILELGDLFDALNISWAGGVKRSVDVVKGN